jgi:hypothetical protein
LIVPIDPSQPFGKHRVSVRRSRRRRRLEFHPVADPSKGRLYRRLLDADVGLGRRGAACVHHAQHQAGGKRRNGALKGWMFMRCGTGGTERTAALALSLLTPTSIHWPTLPELVALALPLPVATVKPMPMLPE